MNYQQNRNNFQNGDGVAFVRQPNGETLKLESVEAFEDWLKSPDLAEANVTRLLWDSLQDAFRSGKRVGTRKAWEAASQEHNIPNPYERRG